MSIEIYAGFSAAGKAGGSHGQAGLISLAFARERIATISCSLLSLKANAFPLVQHFPVLFTGRHRKVFSLPCRRKYAYLFPLENGLDWGIWPAPIKK